MPAHAPKTFTPRDAGDLEPFAAALEDAVLTIRTWEAEPPLGQTRFCVVDTTLAGRSFYVQAMSEPGHDTVLLEVSSGEYGRGAHEATEEERRAMDARGFVLREGRNFRKEVLVLDREDARRVAREVVEILVGVFGFPHGEELALRLHESSIGTDQRVVSALNAAELEGLLSREGTSVRRVADSAADPRAAELGPDRTPRPRFETTVHGLTCAVSLERPVDRNDENEGPRRYRAVRLKRTLDVVVPLASVDAFNSIAPFGRAYADDERRPTVAMGMSLDEGVTVDHLHARLGEWRRLVVTAQLFFEEVAARQSSALVRFGPHAFDEQMHAMARLVLARVRTPHVADALLEWLRADKTDSSAAALEAWLEVYAREHPETGRESSARYRSGASASDVEPWIEMIDGLVVEREGEGDDEVLTVRHTIPHATLRISPRRVRSCAFVTTPGLAMIELELDDAQIVCVGAEDFAFGIRPGAFVVEGVSFVTETGARAGLWQLQFELATTMRMVPGMDVASLGGRLAWLHAALEGARAAGIDCAVETERFERLVSVLRRWLTQPEAASAGRDRA